MVQTIGHYCTIQILIFLERAQVCDMDDHASIDSRIPQTFYDHNSRGKASNCTLYFTNHTNSFMINRETGTTQNMRDSYVSGHSRMRSQKQQAWTIRCTRRTMKNGEVRFSNKNCESILYIFFDSSTSQWATSVYFYTLYH